MSNYSQNVLAKLKDSLQWDQQWLVFRSDLRDIHNAKNHGGLTDLKMQASASLNKLLTANKISRTEHQVLSDEIYLAATETLSKLERGVQ